jgi:glycosyltransferase involved in cell wall biosynthesis
VYKNHRIAVVIPAFNEELLLPETLDGLPAWMDLVFVIDDASRDRTGQLLAERARIDPRVRPITHQKNKGLGQSLIDGYLSSLGSEADITVVMAGDNQMHSGDLPALLDRLIEDGYDYVKGNRLLHQNVGAMPVYRFLGNSVLTILTKFATGYYSLMDPQCGYTAIRNDALRRIPIETMTKGYGYNADILCMLNIGGFSVTDCEVRPVYDREKSKIKLWKYIPKTSAILTRLFLWRLWRRYIVLDFHPLVLFYLFAIFNTVVILVPAAVRFFYCYYFRDPADQPWATLTVLIVTFLITFQSILFALWMDMDYNREINRRRIRH